MNEFNFVIAQAKGTCAGTVTYKCGCLNGGSVSCGCSSYSWVVDPASETCTGTCESESDVCTTTPPSDPCSFSVCADHIVKSVDCAC